MLRAYDWSLQRVLRLRGWTVLVSLLVLAGTVYLFMVIPRGFFPSEDTGQIFAVTEAAQDISYESLVKHQQAVMHVLDQETNILNYTSSVGASGPTTTPNNGRVFIRLKPRSTGRPHVDQLIQQLRPKLAAIPGINVFMQNPPLIRIGGTITKSLYQFTIQGPDLDELYRWAPIVLTNMAALPGFQDVSTDLQINTPQVKVDIDRDRARALGVTAEQIEDALYDAYGSRQVSTIYAPVNQYWVIMEVLPEYQRDSSALSHLYVRSNTGALVPLDAVTKITRGAGPLTVNHFGQLPSVTISFNLAPGVSLGTAEDDVNKMLAEIHIPATLNAGFQGAAQVFESSWRGMGILLLMSILVIYIILGILYESFIHPITILSGLPSAGFGALLTLMLFHIDLNIYAFVGLIMLVGIVKKNAIMMIDFAIEAQRQGSTPFDAIYQGCLLRFRPIMMTTMAALMGTLPIAVGYGAGGEARQPLGLAVVGGLVVSQLLTLFITPVVYLYLESFQQWMRRHLPQRRRSPEPALAAVR
jgi:HAE1 family hydrophobic/amphiphilic exporter-1